MEDQQLWRDLVDEVQSGEGVGTEIWLELPELGAVGFATVLANEPTPLIVDGPGQVVTATFRHDSAEVLDLTFSPTGSVSSDSRLFPDSHPPTNVSASSQSPKAASLSLGVTSAHPFWSVTRDEFVPAGDLEYGEQVVTIDGQLWHLTTITPRAGPETVYNFEVAGEHVYYVGSNGLLVHNVCNHSQRYLKKAAAFARYGGNLGKRAWGRLYENLRKARRIKNGATEMHHAIPMFAGGNKKGQNLVELPQHLHQKLYRLINAALNKRNLPGMQAGGRYFQNAAAQRKALSAIAEGSQKFDKAHPGYDVFSTFLDEFKKGNFTKYW